MKIRISRNHDGGWQWEVWGKIPLAVSTWPYYTADSCRRTVRRLFGKGVKVEVVK